MASVRPKIGTLNAHQRTVLEHLSETEPRTFEQLASLTGLNATQCLNAVYALRKVGWARSSTQPGHGNKLFTVKQTSGRPQGQDGLTRCPKKKVSKRAPASGASHDRGTLLDRLNQNIEKMLDLASELEGLRNAVERLSRIEDAINIAAKAS